MEALLTAPCKGMNCGCTDGVSHSLECQAEHAAAIAGGVFSKPEQQAQAEPEVVAIADGTFNCVAPLGMPLITLQSHREAIAQHRAALEECGEALKAARANPGDCCPWFDKASAAITNANQVLKGEKK